MNIFGKKKVEARLEEVERCGELFELWSKLSDDEVRCRTELLGMPREAVIGLAIGMYTACMGMKYDEADADSLFMTASAATIDIIRSMGESDG